MVPTPGSAEALDLGHECFLAFCSEQVRLADGEVVETDGVLMLVGPNREPSAIDIAARLDPAVPPADAVAAAVRFYGERGRSFMLYTRSDTEADVAEAAVEAGLVPLLRTPEMHCWTRPEDAPVSEGVAIRHVSTPDDVVAFASVMAAGYADAGLSRAEAAVRFRHPDRWLGSAMTLFLATLDGEPVSSGLTFVGAPVAGAFLLSTVPEARGRGIGQAVVTRMTQAAFDVGSPMVGLQASRMGEAIYRRIGYHGVYLYRGFFWNPPAARR